MSGPELKKVIVVFGATGLQGSGLVDAILDDRSGPFAVRAVTRDVNGEKARALVQKGAEVAAADLDDPHSVELALRGAYGAFFVTLFTEGPETELRHARTLAEAAGAAKLQHAIWSTLEDTRRFMPLDDPRMPTLHGKYKVPHLDVKGEADGFFRERGVPTTFLLTCSYFDNFISYNPPKRGPDGRLAVTLPTGSKKVPSIWAGDIGRCAYGIFKAGQPYIGKYVGIASEMLTGDQTAETLSKALGQPIVFNAVPPDVFRSFGFPGAEEFGNMYQFFADFEAEFCGARDVAATRELNPGLLTLEQWLARYKDQIPLE